MPKIIIGDPIEPEISVAPLPADRSLGSAIRYERVPFQVYFVQGVHQKILEHIHQTPTIESGGVLVGHPFRTPNNEITFVVITGAIPQHSRNRSVVHFTVGPTEVAAVRQEIEERYPGQVSVGWYHSHPGHGIFLSSQDMTIVQSIYNASWHVALVVDPLRQKEGIFVGSSGKQLGLRGDQTLGSSWTELSETPPSLHAITYFNQAKEALHEQRPAQAQKALKQLKQLIEQNNQLDYWKNSTQLAELENQLQQLLATAGSLTSQQSIASPTPRAQEGKESRPNEQNQQATYRSPQPNRPNENNVAILWLIVSGICTFLFGLLVFIVVFFFEEDVEKVIVLVWGVLLSILAVFTAGYSIVNKRAFRQTSHVNGMGVQLEQPSPRIMAPDWAWLLMALVLIIWFAYAALWFLPILPAQLHTGKGQQPFPAVRQTPPMIMPTLPISSATKAPLKVNPIAITPTPLEKDVRKATMQPNTAVSSTPTLILVPTPTQIGTDFQTQFCGVTKQPGLLMPQSITNTLMPNWCSTDVRK